MHKFLCKQLKSMAINKTDQNGFADNGHCLAGWGGREVYREVGKT